MPLRNTTAAFVALLLFGTMFPPASEAVTLPDGDWYISEDLLVDGENITLKGDVYILDGATLTFNGSNIDMTDQWKIFVDRGGRLDVYASHVTAEYPSSWWKNIIVHGNSTMEHSSFEGLTVRFEQRAHLDAYSCEFGNCEIAVEVENSVAMLWDCTFVDIGQQGVGLYGYGEADVVGCRFFRTASDEIEWHVPEGGMGNVQPGAYVSRCLFTDIAYIGVRLGNGGYYYNSGIYCEQWYDGPPVLYVHQSCFAGFYYGIQVDVVYQSANYLVDSCTFEKCERAIDFDFGPNYAGIRGNTIRDCYSGILLNGGGFAISDNEITNCTSLAIYDNYPYYYNYYRPDCRIEGNLISKCEAGISLSEYTGTLRCNTFLDCTYYGYDSSLNQGGVRQLRIEGNLFRNCSRPTSASEGALRVSCMNDCSIRIENNQFEGNGGAAIDAEGTLTVSGNRINGSRLGMRLDASYYLVEADHNTITGGELGIELGCQAVAEWNNITGVKEGIRMQLAPLTMTQPSLSWNMIEASGCGIRITDIDGSCSLCETKLEGNSIVSGGDAVFLDCAPASLHSCDFEGTLGYCIYALGSAPVLGTNSYGSTAEGILKQEWYLTVTAQQRTDEDYGGSWVTSAGAELTVLDRHGDPAFIDRTDNGGRSRTNLTEYTLDLMEGRTDYGPYNLTVLKARTGVGRALVELTNNTNLLISLFPMPDLVLEFLELPSMRPAPAALVPVNISILNDATYMPSPRTYSSVKVILKDNGEEVNQRIISNIFWGEWCNITFMWTALEGGHLLQATVDPDNIVQEVFEDNNRLSRNISVNERPIASLGADSADAVIGEEVMFTANGSWDDSGLTGFFYDFGDGSESGWTEDAWAAHRYLKQGYYEPRLMVRDRDGATSEWSTSLMIGVSGRSLDIGLSADRTFVDSLVPLTFSASARNTAGDIADYLWDFGDGSTDYGRNASRVEHVYQRPGTFPVSVRITDTTGSNGTARLSIVVRNRPPVASFTFSPETPTVLSEVSFVSTSTDADGSVVRWLWDFGDGTQNWGPSPTHLYLDDGCYTVILAVLDDSGSWSAPFVRDVSLPNLPPKARAAVSPQPLRVGQLALFDGSSTSDPDDAPGSLRFCWSSQDGWRSEGPKMSRRFDAPGKYVIRLTVTDDDGAKDYAEISFEVKEKGTIVPGLDFRPAAFGLMGLAALMFLLTFIVRRRAKAAAPPATPPKKRNGARPAAPPGRKIT